MHSNGELTMLIPSQTFPLLTVPTALSRTTILLRKLEDNSQVQRRCAKKLWKSKIRVRPFYR